MGKPALLAFVIALALGSTRCETSVSDAPVSFGVPEITATPFDLNHRQSETAIVSSSAGFFPFVVVAYNDGSVAFNNPTADYSTQTYHRGWSQLGWSTSATSGVTWDYRGQVPPMLANAFSTNGGWSALIGDPAAAVDRKSTNHVYISNLGVSDATWNAVSAGTDTIVFGSAGLQYLGHTVRSPIDLADSLCVAQSNDGGISFSALGCLVLGSAAQVDRTALAVDGKGFVWVATISVPAANLANFGHFRLFRSTAPASVSAFVEVGLPVANVYDPVLKNDAEGNIWLGGQGVGAVGANDGSVWIQEFDTTKNVWRVSRDVAKLCGKTVDRDVNPFFGDFSTLRNAHPYDFDIGLDETVLTTKGLEVVRVAFEQTDDNDPTRHLVQVAQYDLGLSSCSTSATTGPSSDSTTWIEVGTQFMPSLNFANRGGEPYWSLAYLTTANVKDPKDQYIYPASERITKVPQSSNPRMVSFTALAPPDWYACTDSAGYWGDYFGSTQIRDGQGFWWNVSAFTSSRPAPPCTGGGGSPQHVVASRW